MAVKVITADASGCTQEASLICSLGNQPSKLGRGGILIQFPEVIDRLSTLELYEISRKPEPEDIVRLDGKHCQMACPRKCSFPVGLVSAARIILRDFGEYFNPQYHPNFPRRPFLSSRFFNEPLSFASDIWTLACTIWEIAGYRPLFEAFFPTADRVTAEQVEVLAILPPEWWGKWS